MAHAVSGLSCIFTSGVLPDTVQVVTLGAFLPNDRLTKILRLVQGGHKPALADLLLK